MGLKNPASIFLVASAFAWPIIRSIILLLALLIVILLVVRGLIYIYLESYWLTLEHKLLLHIGKALNF